MVVSRALGNAILQDVVFFCGLLRKRVNTFHAEIVLFCTNQKISWPTVILVAVVEGGYPEKRVCASSEEIPDSSIWLCFYQSQLFFIVA